ncbi:MAG: hypothetical protein NZ989_01150 [Bacteroidia bacterium]|nr:hypothetical protein [Bacteroidia bacterium]
MLKNRLVWLPPGAFSYVQAWFRSLPWILGGTLLVGTGVGIWQLLEPNEYLCEVEFVPPSTKYLSAHPPQLVPGETEDLEHFYSYLISPALLKSVVDSFNLVEHYGLSHISNPTRRLKVLQRELDRRISCRITKYSTLYFSVLDRDPEYAVRISRFILDKIRKELDVFTQESKVKVGKLEEEVNVEAKIEEVKARLAQLRKDYGIIIAMDTRAGHINLDINRNSTWPEAIGKFDEVMVLERELAYLTDLKMKFMNYRIERLHYLSLYKDKLWLILPPERPKTPAYPRPLRWSVVSALLSFIVFSMISLYLHHMRRLSEAEILEKVS